MPAGWDKRIIPFILLALSEGLAIVALCQIHQSGETPGRLTSPLLESIVPSATVVANLKVTRDVLAGKFGRKGSLWPPAVLSMFWAIDRVMSLAEEHPFVRAAHGKSFKSALVDVLATRSSTARMQIWLHIAMLTYGVYLWTKIDRKARRVLGGMVLCSFGRLSAGTRDESVDGGVVEVPRRRSVAVGEPSSHLN